MDRIKYVVVCKKGYIFAADETAVKQFIEEHGIDISYYVGYFKPVENLDFIKDLDTSLKNLGSEE